MPAVIEIGGRPFELVGTGDYTLDEWCRICLNTGMTPNAFEEAMRDLNPIAWREAFTVAIGRANGGAGDPHALEQLGKVNLLGAIVAASRVGEPAEPESLPPNGAAGPNASGNDGSTSGDGSETSGTGSSESAGEPDGTATSDARETSPLESGAED